MDNKNSGDPASISTGIAFDPELLESCIDRVKEKSVTSVLKSGLKEKLLEKEIELSIVVPSFNTNDCVFGIGVSK
jgi:hypothetical protein